MVSDAAEFLMGSRQWIHILTSGLCERISLVAWKRNETATPPPPPLPQCQTSTRIIPTITMEVRTSHILTMPSNYTKPSIP